jgi:hypothetical protein
MRNICGTYSEHLKYAENMRNICGTFDICNKYAENVRNVRNFKKYSENMRNAGNYRKISGMVEIMCASCAKATFQRGFILHYFCIFCAYLFCICCACFLFCACWFCIFSAFFWALIIISWVAHVSIVSDVLILVLIISTSIIYSRTTNFPVLARSLCGPCGVLARVLARVLACVLARSLRVIARPCAVFGMSSKNRQIRPNCF